MADGVAGVAAFSALFDPAAGVPAPGAALWTPAPAPSARELLGDNARRRAGELGRALSGLMDPAGALRRARRTWPAWREAAGQRVPAVTLNRGRIGLDRGLALVRGDLGRASQYGHTALSAAEDIPWRCRRLVIGTGTDGALPVMQQVRDEACRRKVDLVVLPTAEAIDALAKAPAETNAILHLTCRTPQGSGAAGRPGGCCYLIAVTAWIMTA